MRELTADFLAWNCESAQAQLRARPHTVPVETPQSCVSCCIALWENFDHSKLHEAYKKRGLTLALDGIEDWKMAARQSELFHHPIVDGPSQRRKAEATVDAYLAQYDPAEIKMEMVFDLVTLDLYDQDPDCCGTDTYMHILHNLR